MADLGPVLLRSTPELHADAREYLLLAAMTGMIASGRHAAARALWEEQLPQLSRQAAQPVFRLLRCHAEAGNAAPCAAAFRAYAED
jgi:hypothetical protein